MVVGGYECLIDELIYFLEWSGETEAAYVPETASVAESSIDQELGNS